MGAIYDKSIVICSLIVVVNLILKVNSNYIKIAHIKFSEPIKNSKYFENKLKNMNILSIFKN